MRIQEIKKRLIHYYIEEQKEEFILRLWGPKEDPEIKCYYKGIQVFSFDTGGEFKVNEALLLPNDKNDNKNKEQAKQNIEKVLIPKKPIERNQALEKIGISLSLNSKIVLPFSKKIQYEKESKESIQILKRNRETIRELLRKSKIETAPWKNKYSRKRKEKHIGYETTILNAQSLDYTQIYKLILLKYNWNAHLEELQSNTGKDITGYTSLKIQVNYRLNNIDIFLDNLIRFNQIMKTAIEVYSISSEKQKEDDFTNTRVDSEKAYQQKLMNWIGTHKINFNLSKKEIPFDLEDIPFEMEYYIYPSDIYTIRDRKEKRKRRNDNNRKGRLDNIVINPKTKELKLIEIKIEEDVLGGTNGIHKHLLDLTNAIHKNPHLVDEILDHGKNRRDILKYMGIQDAFEIPNFFQKIEYYIICGYTNRKSKETIEKRLKLIEDKTILQEEVYFSKEEYQKCSQKEYQSFKEDLKKRTPENIANEYPLGLLEKNILEYCEILKKGDREKKIPSIDVKIFLVDENFETFEEKITNHDSLNKN